MNFSFWPAGRRRPALAVVCRPHTGPLEQRLLIFEGNGYSVGRPATVAPAGLAAWALARCRCIRRALAHRAGPAPGRRDRQQRLRPPNRRQAIRLVLSPAPAGTPPVIRIDGAAPYVADENGYACGADWRNARFCRI